MSPVENPVADPATRPGFAIAHESKMDPIIGRIDLLAVLTTLLGALLLGFSAMVYAVIELAKLVSFVWADSLGRWLIAVLAVAVIWVVVRGKKLCIF